RDPASVMSQEIGHASGTYAHARNPSAAMAYDSQSSLISIGTYTPFPWTDSRVPDVETRNEREYYDWALSAGRFAMESDVFTQQPISTYMSEMTGDSLPRNDRVAIAGRIDSIFDVDEFSYNASANKTVAFDIDSAEFQNPLDARMEIIAPNGSVIASSDDALDRDSGLFSVDPYLTFTFPSAGAYKIRVMSKAGSFGNYRLKTIESQAFDTAGPRIVASLPNGGVSYDSTRQLTFYFNHQIDPASITSSNVIIQGATSGVRSGTLTFDPTDTTLTWFADAALPVDSYTVTIVSGASGLRDLRGNQLDGETDGTMSFPEVSGNGSPGGNFVTSFDISGSDTSAAFITTQNTRRHPYNRLVTSLTFSDELDTFTTANAKFTIRSTGDDNAFDTADDRLLPADVLIDKVRNFAGRVIDVYSRGVLAYGNYRIEAVTRDAAGNNVVINRLFGYTTGLSNGNLVNGPSVASLSIPAGTWVASADSITTQFSMPLDLSSLNTHTFKLRYSTDSAFHNVDDVYLTDADGSIAWDAKLLQATFAPSGGLAHGYYLIELSGVMGTNGLALDGEFQNTRIAGSSLATQWQDAPSGDGFAGGDYRASFIVADLVAPTVVDSMFDFETSHIVKFEMSENVTQLDENS
ncbi:MAG TPA: Ig-like domain-containing protein, partial [Tepidisphaeraceae bacterium]|nr:Ig-like domain-containing protein [Tepidisphaeraceae bacterium]